MANDDRACEDGACEDGACDCELSKIERTADLSLSVQRTVLIFLLNLFRYYKLGKFVRLDRLIFSELLHKERACLQSTSRPPPHKFSGSYSSVQLKQFASKIHI